MQKQDLKISKRQEKQSGITLVALVITVVVMLILAGVAIAAVVDGDGLFSKTREAAETYENAADKESYMLTNLMGQINHYIKDSGSGEIVDPGDEGKEPGDEDPIGIKVNQNQTFTGESTGSYSDPIIPKGFAPINENGADWGTEEGYQKGLVITDEVDGEGNSIGNEFVWIPVDGTTVKFERYDFEKGLEFSECSETVPTEIKESVTTNGGFYIARFEAGKPQDGTLATDGSVKPVSKQGAEVWNNIAWSDNNKNDDANPGNGAVTVARGMYPEEDTNYGVTSTLIYGTQWDTALNFIGAYDVGEANYDTYATDSTGMGNYNGTNGADDIVSTSEPAVCGAREGFRQKNIYDMAGNVWEWTMEKYNTNRVGRGGTYDLSGSVDPASYRYHFYVDDDSNGRFPCSTLYKIVKKFKILGFSNNPIKSYKIMVFTLNS